MENLGKGCLDGHAHGRDQPSLPHVGEVAQNETADVVLTPTVKRLPMRLSVAEMLVTTLDYIVLKHTYIYIYIHRVDVYINIYIYIYILYIYVCCALGVCHITASQWWLPFVLTPSPKKVPSKSYTTCGCVIFRVPIWLGSQEAKHVAPFWVNKNIGHTHFFLQMPPGWEAKKKERQIVAPFWG